MKILIVLSLALLLNYGIAQAQNPTYECRKESGHVIHIITLDPSQYAINFIKAHNQVFGRETIKSIAQRTNADIAINAGFFEIGGSQDGMPSKTLTIHKKIFGLTFQKQACLTYDQKDFKIQSITPHLKITIGENELSPEKTNVFSGKAEVTLYSCSWGNHTLTPLKGRKEIAIDQEGKVVEFSQQGNIEIPQNGFVLSFPFDYPLSPIKRGDKAIFHLEPSFLQSEKVSVVTGIPSLIQEGTINPSLFQHQTSFYQSPHARTAIGIQPNGDIILVVAEHVYQKPLSTITLEDIKSIILNNKEKLVKKYKKLDVNSLTLSEVKETLIEELSTQSPAVGLTLPELAELMKNLNCEFAINLDGGGSSSLFFHNQVINRTVGDQDESMGQSVLRPISNAIVFKKIIHN